MGKLENGLKLQAWGLGHLLLTIQIIYSYNKVALMWTIKLLAFSGYFFNLNFVDFVSIVMCCSTLKSVNSIKVTWKP